MSETGGLRGDSPSASTLFQTLKLAVGVQEQLAEDSARQAQRIHWLRCALEQILTERPLSEQHGSCKFLVTPKPSNTRNNLQETLHATTSGRMQVCQTHLPETPTMVQPDDFEQLVLLDEPPSLQLPSFGCIPQEATNWDASAGPSVDRSKACSSKDVPTATLCCSGQLTMDAHALQGEADTMVATRLAVECRQLPVTPAVTTCAVMAILGRGPSVGRSSSPASHVSDSDKFTEEKVVTNGDLESGDNMNIAETLQPKSCTADQATTIKQLWPRGASVDANGMQRNECHLDCVANNRECDGTTSIDSSAAIAPSISFGPEISGGRAGVIGSASSGPSGRGADFPSVPRCKAVARVDPFLFASDMSLKSTVSAPCTTVTGLDEACILKSVREAASSPIQSPSNILTMKEASGLQQSSATEVPELQRSMSLPLPNKQSSAGTRAHRRGARGTDARKPKKDMASLERKLAHQLWQDMGMIPKEEEVRSGRWHPTCRDPMQHFWRLSAMPALMQPSARVEPEVLPAGTNEKSLPKGDEFAEKNAEEPGKSGHLPTAKDAATDAAESLGEPTMDPAGISTKLIAGASHAPPPFLAFSQISGKSSHLSVMDGQQRVTSMQRRVPSMSHVRDVHQQNLIKDMCGGLNEPVMIIDDSENSCCCTSMCIWNFIQNMIFRSCGVLPWSVVEYPVISWLYQCFVLLLVVAVTVIHCWHLTLKNDDDIMSLELSIDVVLAMGCVFSLAACGALWRSTLIVEACGLLQTYTTKHVLWSEVKDSCWWDMSMSLACWLMALIMKVAVHTLVTTGHVAETHLWANFALFTIVSGVLTGLVSFSLYWCRCMMTMVDDFSLTLNDHQQFGASLQDWNLLQSVHRNTCQAIQIPFMVMQTTAMVICIMVILETIRPLERERLLVMGPGLLVAVAIFRICIYAGILTDKCTRLPILISGLGLKNKNGEGLNLNWERLYAVSFISTNQAGFFIFEVRVTSAMVCKAAYLVGAVAFGLVSSQKYLEKE